MTFPRKKIVFVKPRPKILRLVTKFATFIPRLLLGVICFLIIGTATAEDDYAEYEDASPKPVVPSRKSPLLNRRNPLTKGKPSTTTTTTTAAPQEVTKKFTKKTIFNNSS